MVYPRHQECRSQQPEQGQARHPVHDPTHWRARTGGDQPAPDGSPEQGEADSGDAQVTDETWLESAGLTGEPFRPAEHRRAPRNPDDSREDAEGDHAEPVEGVRGAAPQGGDAGNGEQHQWRQQQQGRRAARAKAVADAQKYHQEGNHRQSQWPRRKLAALCPERPAGQGKGGPSVPWEHHHEAPQVDERLGAGVQLCRLASPEGRQVVR